MKVLVTCSFAAWLLAACALIEPRAKVKFVVHSQTPVEAVFACTEASIHALRKQQTPPYGWVESVTIRDIERGLLETGQFNEINVTGIRTQIRYRQDTGAGVVAIKASGPYFVDLGAEQAAHQLAGAITKCF